MSTVLLQHAAPVAVEEERRPPSYEESRAGLEPNTPAEPPPEYTAHPAGLEVAPPEYTQELMGQPRRLEPPGRRGQVTGVLCRVTRVTVIRCQRPTIKDPKCKVRLCCALTLLTFGIVSGIVGGIYGGRNHHYSSSYSFEDPYYESYPHNSYKDDPFKENTLKPTTSATPIDWDSLWGGMFTTTPRTTATRRHGRYEFPTTTSILDMLRELQREEEEREEASWANPYHRYSGK